MSRTFDELITTAMLDLSRDATPPDDLAQEALAGAARRHRLILIACVATAVVSLGTGSLAAISNSGGAAGRTPAPRVTSTPDPGGSTSSSACPSPGSVTASDQPCLGDQAGRTLPAPGRSPASSTTAPEPAAPTTPKETKHGRPHPTHPHGTG